MRSFKDLIHYVYTDNQADFTKVDFTKCENIVLALTKIIKIINTSIVEQTSLKGNFLTGFKNIRKNNYLDIILSKTQEINNQIESWKKQGYLPISLSLKTQSRLIIGLGSSHVLETSITLHHIYGIPYIPASALKGVCRMVSFWQIAESKGILNNEGKLNKLQNEFYGELSTDRSILKYQLLFGAQNFKGLLLFFDSYPEIQNNQQIFDLDVMNVHYPSYYEDKEGRTPPGDWENPRPIFFLTLKEGIKFNFNILFDRFRAEKIRESNKEELVKLKISENAKEIIDAWENNSQQLQNEIKKLLEEALKKFGVGAKTRLGYGIFE